MNKHATETRAKRETGRRPAVLATAVVVSFAAMAIWAASASPSTASTHCPVAGEFLCQFYGR